MTNEEAFRKGIEESVRCEQNVSVKERWKRLKETVVKSAVTHIGYKNGRVAKKLWITSEVMNKMRERRKWKNSNVPYGKKKYRQLNNELRRETERAKEKWWENECKELEELDGRGRSDLVYAKVNKLSAKNKSSARGTAIRDDKGEPLTDPEEVRKQWKEYIEVLYDKDGKPRP